MVLKIVRRSSSSCPTSACACEDFRPIRHLKRCDVQALLRRTYRMPTDMTGNRCRFSNKKCPLVAILNRSIGTAGCRSAGDRRRFIGGVAADARDQNRRSVDVSTVEGRPHIGHQPRHGVWGAVERKRHLRRNLASAAASHSARVAKHTTKRWTLQFICNGAGCERAPASWLLQNS